MTRLGVFEARFTIRATPAELKTALSQWQFEYDGQTYHVSEPVPATSPPVGSPLRVGYSLATSYLRAVLACHYPNGVMDLGMAYEFLAEPYGPRPGYYRFELCVGYADLPLRIMIAKGIVVRLSARYSKALLEEQWERWKQPIERELERRQIATPNRFPQPAKEHRSPNDSTKSSTEEEIIRLLRDVKTMKAYFPDYNPDTAETIYRYIPQARKNWRKHGGEWGTGYVADECNVSYSTVSRYLSAMYKAGIRYTHDRIEIPHRNYQKKDE